MEYRLAKTEDAKEIYEIVQDTIKRVYPKYYLPEIVNMFCDFHNQENINEDIQKRNVYVLLEDHKIIGTGTVKENYITRVYVLPAFQGKGYGTFIMDRLETEIGKQHDRVEIDASLPACKLYYNRGYQTINHGALECANGVILVYEIMEKKIREERNTETYREGNGSRIYYNDGKILIRDMLKSDAQIITDEEIAQGWDASIDKYEMRLRHQMEGKSISIVAEYQGNIAGYINVYPNSECDVFANRGYSEIVDFGVLVKYRRHGIGSRLMDIAEQLASEYSDIVYLGVGMHSGYGSAQRMYIKRGYIPDGTGVWYGDKVCKPYADCCNNDDLVLYLSKRLR